MKKLIGVELLFLLLLMPIQGLSTIINVPEDYVTIQEALNAVSEGDTVLVAPGVYKENIVWPKKDGIKLFGSDENKTIIDGEQKGCVIHFDFEKVIITSKTIISKICIKNGSNDYGGGIFCNYANPTLSNMIIMNNTANKNGGGLCLFYSSPELSHLVIINNFSSEYSGGISCIFSNPIMSNILISENSANFAGGGATFDRSSPKLYDTKITANNSELGAGLICAKSKLECLNIIIDENSASKYGGGIVCMESDSKFSNISITNNTAKLIGAGIYCVSSNPTFSKVSISDNIVDSYGGGIGAIDSKITLINITITGNTALKEGGGIACFNSSSIVTNSIIYYNIPQAIFIKNISQKKKSTLHSLTINYSNIENGLDGISHSNTQNPIFWGDGNISTKPFFIDTYENHGLNRYSPCINTGHPDLDGDGISWEKDPDDQDPDGSRMDMGSHYFPHLLALKIPNQISENHGTLIGSIHSNYILTQELLVNLLSSDSSFVSVPDIVVIPAGYSETTFDLNIINNQNYDTNKKVVITATSQSWLTDKKTIRIIDDELWVTINYPENNASTDNLMGIFGEASNRFNDLSAIQLQISNGNQYINQDLEFVSTPMWITSQGTNSWFFNTSKINWEQDTAYTITARAISTKDYTAITTITYNNGNLYKPSTITCECFLDHIVSGEPIEIHGQIDPFPTSGTLVDLELRHLESDEKIFYRPEITNRLGGFTFNVSCGTINKSGDWTVQTFWKGDNELKEAKSDIQTLHVSKSQSRLSLYTTSGNLTLEESITFSGKLSYQIDCDNGLLDQMLTLKTIDPDGIENTDPAKVKVNFFGNYTIPDYAFNRLGKWRIQLAFSGNQGMSPCTSEAIDIHVVETAGYAIIVQGKIKNSEGLRAHNKTTQFVYKQLENRGFFIDEQTNNDDIYYLNYDISQSGVDSIPTKEAVKNAVTEWAKEKMDQKPANLYIVMVDHGLADEFFIYPEIITSADLAQWLNTLQTSFVNEDAKKQEIIVILGFCRSGSFIDELSGNHRVIITSASKDESSYKGPKELDPLGNILRDGEYFITELFKKISFGQPIKEAFEKAVLLTELYTQSPSGTPNSPFFDKSLQHPLIDDNGDKQGSNILSDPKGDGTVSENLYIGVSALTKNDPGDVSIIEVSDAIFLKENESSVDELWASVDDYSRLGTIWVEIKAPDYTTINPVVSGQAEMDLNKEVYDRLDIIDFFSKRYKWEDLTGFETPGTYQVFYFAIDDITKHVSPLVETLVYKAKAGNHPPNPFLLISPENNLIDTESTTGTAMILRWNHASDPDEDHVTYTVLLSAKYKHFFNPIQQTSLSNNSCMFNRSHGIKNFTRYYWKVIAIDQYGAKQESEIWSFYTDDKNNPPWGALEAYVYNEINGQLVNNASLIVGNLPNPTNTARGYFLDYIPPGEYRITIKADGYFTKIYSDIEIPRMDTLIRNFRILPEVKKGDLNVDGEINIRDVIFGLKILAHLEDVSVSVNIDMRAVLYVFQEVLK